MGAREDPLLDPRPGGPIGRGEQITGLVRRQGVKTVGDIGAEVGVDDGVGEGRIAVQSQDRHAQGADGVIDPHGLNRRDRGEVGGGQFRHRPALIGGYAVQRRGDARREGLTAIKAPGRNAAQIGARGLRGIIGRPVQQSTPGDETRQRPGRRGAPAETGDEDPVARIIGSRQEGVTPHDRLGYAVAKGVAQKLQRGIPLGPHARQILSRPGRRDRKGRFVGAVADQGRRPAQGFETQHNIAGMGLVPGLVGSVQANHKRRHARFSIREWDLFGCVRNPYIMPEVEPLGAVWQGPGASRAAETSRTSGSGWLAESG